MANIYDEKEKVLSNNPPEFIKDFKRIHTIVILAATSKYFFVTLKNEVWRSAKYTEIRYELRRDIYKNGREVMVIY